MYIFIYTCIYIYTLYDMYYNNIVTGSVMRMCVCDVDTEYMYRVSLMFFFTDLASQLNFAYSSRKVATLATLKIESGRISNMCTE